MEGRERHQYFLSPKTSMDDIINQINFKVRSACHVVCDNYTFEYKICMCCIYKVY